jgi:DNA-binding transcriptional regulator YdaS (Cro superfamily)
MDTSQDDWRPERHALERAAKALGGQAAVASACGFTDRRNVFPWFSTNRRVPAERCPAIERATRAKASAENDPALVVTCEELRPDIDWRVLREQAA